MNVFHCMYLKLHKKNGVPTEIRRTSINNSTMENEDIRLHSEQINDFEIGLL